MAVKRMFSMSVVDSDDFLDLPLPAQGLYFHLCMRADDDGFLNNPRKIQRMIGASEEDLALLLERKFLLGFDSGVVAVTHWLVNNTIRRDRYTPTRYREEMGTLAVRSGGEYARSAGEVVLPILWQPPGNHPATQDSTE